MTALYEIANEYIEIFNRLTEDGFDGETIENTLSPITASFEDKAKNVVAFTNNSQSELDRLEEHKSNIESRIKSKKKEIEFFRNYLKSNMIRLNIKSIKCDFFDIFVKNSMPKLIKEDEMLLPSEYIKTEVVTKIDDSKLKSDLKDGLIIPGAHLEESQSLTIKLK